MNSLKTYHTKIMLSMRECTCFNCRQKIPVGKFHVRIVGDMDRLSLKLCRTCITNLRSEVYFMEGC